MTMAGGTQERGEHILACLSSSPSNGRIIRTAARMARAFGGQFTALYVRTPGSDAASEDDKRRLRDNQALAEQLGARTETVFGQDVAFQIAEYARLSGVTKIVLGRSAVGRRRLFGRPPLTEQLLSYAPEVDIHIIPDQSADGPYRPRQGADVGGSVKDAAKSLGILAAATLLSLLFHTLGFTDANIIMVYILGVLLTAVVTTRRVYALASSVASVLVFNYLFTVPRFSFAAYGTGYPVTFLIMFLTAYIASALAARYKAQAGQAALTARRTKLLFDANQALSKAKGRDEIMDTAAKQLVQLLGRNTVMYPLTDGRLQEPGLYPAGPGDMAYDTVRERPAAWRALTAETPGDGGKGGYLYFPLKVNDRRYGVAGVDTRTDPLDGSERDILFSVLAECALALENEQNAREKEAAAVLAESERLRADLLRTISHDLRTPLTTISGNAGNLLANEDKFSPETRRAIYGDIYDDAQWLTELVENLLYATRIEEGRMALHTSAELLTDIVDEAAAHSRRKSRGGCVSVTHGDDLLLVRADAQLVVQVIVNLTDNAFKYAGADAAVSITTGRQGDMAEVLVADTGPGVPDGEKERIFEKFYCGLSHVADNRRRLGLGLYLCRAIIQAHGGTIEVRDNQPHGAVFRFTLPLEEVKLHE